MKNYREIIRGLREDRDLKQIDVATVLGTTQQHYSKYENGEYEMPIRALTLLADYYNVSVDYLLGRTECAEGMSGLKVKVTAKHTAGKIISDILSLSAEGRAAVIEYVSMWTLKEAFEKKNDGQCS